MLTKNGARCLRQYDNHRVGDVVILSGLKLRQTAAGNRSLLHDAPPVYATIQYPLQQVSSRSSNDKPSVCAETPQRKSEINVGMLVEC